ncbi:MAG: PorV/PorQ family protein [Candidatus Zixiibacteriota bacterium]
MIRNLSKIIALVLVLASTSFAAKYAGEAFALGAGARPLALGGAYVALAGDPAGLYYNPAGIAQIQGRQIALLHSETFGSLLNHDYVAYAHPVNFRNKAGAIAAGIYRVGGGGIILTEKDPITGGPKIISEEGHYDYMVLLGAGMKLSDSWRFGATSKIIVRSLANNSAWGLGLDIGVQYGGNEGFALGANLTNATSTFLAYDNGTRESILPALKLGATYARSFDQFTVRAIADGDFLFEGRDAAAQASVGAISLDSHLGAELSYHDIVYFRGGSDIGRLALGVGLRFNRFQLDGAFLNHNDLDNSYRISLNIAL